MLEKLRLAEIRTEEDMFFVFPQEVAFQVDENRLLKEKFQILLENLRESFRSRISAFEELEIA